MLDVDVVAIQLYLVYLGGDYRREPGDAAVEQAEARAVGRALDVQPPQFAVPQRVLLVRADVADRVVLTILGVRQADLLAVDDHLRHCVHLEVLDLGHEVPSQCGPRAPPPPDPEPVPPGCGPAPRRRSRGRSSARPWLRGFPGSPGRRRAPGRPARWWRRGCTALRC